MPIPAVAAAIGSAVILALAAAQPLAAQQQSAGGSVAADTPAGQSAAGQIAEAMRLPEIFAIMADEGGEYGRTLEESMFPGSGGVRWAADVARIYDAGRGYVRFREGFDRRLSGSAHLAEIEAFLTGELGRKVVELEVSARRALLDDAVEEAARMKLAELAARGDPKYALVQEFIAANDLIESNVVGGLNAAREFYLGLADGGAFDGEMTEEQILQDVWSQEPDIRAETEGWIGALLSVAFAPLSDDELRRYIAFSRSPAGRDLNRALFAAFDESFLALSRELGLAAAKYIVGQTL